MDLERVSPRRILSGVLGAVLVLGVLGLVGFAVLPVPATPGDTAFYVVNGTGTAADYPTEPAVGQNVTVVVGVENGEHRQMTYQLVVRTRDSELERHSITLADGERWQRSVTLSFDEAGEKRVRLLLHRGERVGDTPYRRLHLNFDVGAA